MKRGFWKTDWFLGVVVTLLILFAVGTDLIQSLERKAYDMGVQASSRNPSEKIAVIAIDKESIDNIGRWPWSREVQAKMIDLLANAKAKVIGASTLFGRKRRHLKRDFQRPIDSHWIPLSLGLKPFKIKARCGNIFH